jgi:plastocyanin
MRAAAIASLATVAWLAAAPALADTSNVSIQFQTFGPAQIDVLPGETVEWDNVSARTHTVTADDGSFDSGDVVGGSSFAREFDADGTYAYHCTIHPGMVGEIDVREVTLAPLPTATVPAGQRIELDGRTATPEAPVRIERDTGTGFTSVATATPAADGTWRAEVPATQTADFRASNDRGASETRRLLVSNRKVVVTATRSGVSVKVTPALPYAHVVLQQYLRERFGWWPERFARLDYVSEASFRVARPARVRVALVDKDGWTPLATSRELVLRRAPARPAGSGRSGRR